METRIAQARAKNPTTASLFVAYMLVLQSFALGFVPQVAFRGGLFGSEICFSGSQSSDGELAPAKGNSSSAHSGDQCCAYHHAGVGPPARDFEPQRLAAYETRADWRIFSPISRSIWPTLPVGSRAPPETARDGA